MSDKKKFAMTEVIRAENHDHLSISHDDHGEGPIAVFLYTPDMNNKMNHFHIELNPDQAEVLREWLDRWLFLRAGRGPLGNPNDIEEE